MPRYVDLNNPKIIHTDRNKFGYGVYHIPPDLPTLDLVERKRGKWIDEPIYKQTIDGKTWDGFTYCSECKEMHKYGYRSKFCPNCGAEMEVNNG